MNDALNDAELAKPIGFPVATPKFWAMTLLTIGLYTFYWSYKNFRDLQVPGNKIINTIFFPLSFFSMMKGVETQAAIAGSPLSLKKLPMALLYLVLTVSTKVADRAGLVLIEVFLMVLAIIPLAYTQGKILSLNKELRPGAHIDSKFSAWDIVGATIGGIIFIFGIIAGLLPPELLPPS